MLLQRLREYGARTPADIPPRYRRTAVKYMVYLGPHGDPQGVVEQSDGGMSGKKNRGRALLVPNISRTAASRANLLVDNAEYALGIPRDPTKAEKAPERHRLFVEQVRDCAVRTEEPAVQAVLAFLERGVTSELRLPEEFDPSANLSFTVVIDGEDVRPVDLAAVRRFWAAQKDELGGPSGGGATGGFECLVCGVAGSVERTLELKVRGIPNGQPTGTALISANKDAFLSYGLKQSENSPICGACAEGFSNALNGLIADEETSYRVGAVRSVFWTREPVAGFSWGRLVKEANAQQVRALLESPWRGSAGATGLDPTPFYAVALTASGGRAVVRDWLESTVGRAMRNLARYFVLQELTAWNGEAGPPLPLQRIAGATVRFRSGDNPPAEVPRALLRLAMTGGKLPHTLLYEAVRRNRAEQTVRRERAVLIKMVLQSWRDQEGEAWMVDLDRENEARMNPDEWSAYLCGRLLAVIEATQRAALGKVNATVVDRFYGTASSAPMSVFSTLLRGTRAHLSKLRRDRPRTHTALEGRLMEVLERLPSFPTVLPLAGQGLFALGYWHQRADDRRAAREAHARGQTPPIPDDDQDDDEINPEA